MITIPIPQHHGRLLAGQGRADLHYTWIDKDLAEGLGLILRAHAGGRGGGSPPLSPTSFRRAIVALPLSHRPRLAGHELPFSLLLPSRNRLDAMDPAAAAPLIVKGAVQAYVGGDPWTGRKPPADVGTVESLGGFLVSRSTRRPRHDTAERRCERAVTSSRCSRQAGWMRARIPSTPYTRLPPALRHVQSRKLSVTAARDG